MHASDVTPCFPVFPLRKTSQPMKTTTRLRRVCTIIHNGQKTPTSEPASLSSIAFATASKADSAHPDPYWSQLQAREVNEILDDLQQRIANPNARPIELDVSSHSRPVAKNGLLYDGDRPVFLGGYGHFDQVIKDLPNFPALGVSAIQDARFWPASMTPDGSGRSTGCPEGGCGTGFGGEVWRARGLSSSRRMFIRNGRWQAYPDIAVNNWGHIQFNIDHPESRRVLEEWTQNIVTAIKDKPALMSVCLTNEPAYFWSGSEPYSAPAYHAELLAIRN